MSKLRLHAVSVGPLRAFEAVSRSLNFRIAAEELHLTQSAVSRQIQSLEADVGAVLFERDTRGVQLTGAGMALLQVLSPWLGRLDMAVRQIRQTEGRGVVSLSTFASLATLWLIPRLEQFRRRSAIDVRVLARDQIVPSEAVGGGHFDAVLRYCRHDEAPEFAVHLFDEVLTPVVSPTLLARARKSGLALRRPADLARHTLIEDLDLLPSTEYRSWFNWLRHNGLSDFQPGRWLYFNLAHQQVQAAVAGHGLALGRLPLVVDYLARGELVEPFAGGAQTRLSAPYAYWLISPPSAGGSDDAQALREWIIAEAARTREAVARYVSSRPFKSKRT